MNSEKPFAIPTHVAIVMDGNNRWAKQRKLSSKKGHRAGAEIARDTVDHCIAAGIPYLTLFAFSSENWLRPSEEVNGLMALFLSVLKRKEIKQFHEKNVRIQFIGNRQSFSDKLQSHMRDVEELTMGNDGVTVTVAADYGGRWDIAQAAKSVALLVKDGAIELDEVDADLISQHTCLQGIPDPDLCIRTGGDCRISNFLLWQFAYTEFYFTKVYWPDFNEQEFERAISDYSKRQRRYGGHAQDEI